MLELPPLLAPAVLEAPPLLAPPVLELPPLLAPPVVLEPPASPASAPPVLLVLPPLPAPPVPPPVVHCEEQLWFIQPTTSPVACVHAAEALFVSQLAEQSSEYSELQTLWTHAVQAGELTLLLGSAQLELGLELLPPELPQARTRAAPRRLKITRQDFFMAGFPRTR
jgi:hypothetical protein